MKPDVGLWRALGRDTRGALIGLVALALAAVWLVSVTESHAAGRSSQNVAYVTYDDSGFMGTQIGSGNIFATGITDAPAPTRSANASVTYTGMTFTPIARASLSTQALAKFDTLLLFQVCDIARSFSAAQLAAVNAFVDGGNKVLLFDADRCATTAGGEANYAWLRFPFTTSAAGPASLRSQSNGVASTFELTERSPLTQNLDNSAFSDDDLEDANTATTADAQWCAAGATVNGLGNRGFFVAYARSRGLLIFNGADYWRAGSRSPGRRGLLVNMLKQPFAPDDLPCSVKLVQVAPVAPAPTSTATPLPTSTPLPILTAAPTPAPLETPETAGAQSPPQVPARVPAQLPATGRLASSWGPALFLTGAVLLIVGVLATVSGRRQPHRDHGRTRRRAIRRPGRRG